MRRIVTAADLLTHEDIGSAESRYAIQSPDGAILVPRPRDGYRFVQWLTAPRPEGPWTPVPPNGRAQWFVRAYYEKAELRG